MRAKRIFHESVRHGFVFGRRGEAKFFGAKGNAIFADFVLSRSGVEWGEACFETVRRRVSLAFAFAGWIHKKCEECECRDGKSRVGGLQVGTVTSARGKSLFAQSPSEADVRSDDMRGASFGDICLAVHVYRVRVVVCGKATRRQGSKPVGYNQKCVGVVREGLLRGCYEKGRKIMRVCSRNSILSRRIATGRGMRGVLVLRGVRIFAFALMLGLALLSASPAALADDYDAKQAGHPLRIVAYALHPVGVALDYLIMRPLHWVVSYEPMKTIFGHTDS